MFDKTIYKKDSKGKVRVLRIYNEDATLHQESGILNGNLITHSKVCVGKNIGKSNETTPIEQAILEAKSKVKDKLTQGYSESLEELNENSKNVILPMLAKSYKDHSKKIIWSNPVYIQPKLDGMRCLAVLEDGKVNLISRQGKTIENVDHIKNALATQAMIRTGQSRLILDGELYNHGMSFQENMKLIKKYRPGETEKISFHLYDLISEESYLSRYAYLKLLKDRVSNPAIELIKTYKIYNEDELTLKHEKFISLGYEGSIIRYGNAGYQMNKRSAFLLKHKDFIDEACGIIDVIPSEARPDQGVLVCTLNGKTFKANLKFSHDERAEILTNKSKYIGNVAEIRFFEYTDDGIPRFPVCVGFRLDK